MTLNLSHTHMHTHTEKHGGKKAPGLVNLCTFSLIWPYSSDNIRPEDSRDIYNLRTLLASNRTAQSIYLN